MRLYLYFDLVIFFVHSVTEKINETTNASSMAVAHDGYNGETRKRKMEERDDGRVRIHKRGG